MQKTRFWTNFLHPFTAGLLAGTVALFLPLLAVGKGQVEQAPQLLPVTPPSPTVLPSPPTDSWDSSQSVCILLETGETETMTMDEYLWRVVAAEMPASFEEEALRAQAVCARTYTLWKMEAGVHEQDGADLCDQSTCCQAYITHEEAEERWEQLSDAYTARISAAVADTNGQILVYNDLPIQAVFFSSSTSATEDAAAVWGSSVPYLLSVESPEGDEVPNYRSTVTLSATELKQLLSNAGLNANLSAPSSQWLGDISYTASGRVAQLRLGGLTLSGTAVRSLLGLRSACFEVEEENGEFTFSVTGYGHGVGMSQYGANSMAASGASWEEIVTHYYSGVEIRPAEGYHP